MSFDGITEKVMNDGTKAIMVRYKVGGKSYPVRNFTKYFNCKTKTQAKKKLAEVKTLIRQGDDPFGGIRITLDDVWKHWVERKKKLYKNKEEAGWSPPTVRDYESFYKNYLKKDLGHKKIDKITFANLVELQDNFPDNVGAVTKNKVKRVLSPIFDHYIKLERLKKNVAKQLDRVSEKVDKKLENRVKTNSLNILKKLYEAIPYLVTKKKNQQKEVQMFMYLLILTAHRRGELDQLKVEHLDFENNKIVAPADITKSDEVYHYPIPSECLDYFKGIKSGSLFPTFSYKSHFEMFQRLIRLTDIEFFEGCNLTPHDTRRLMLSVMISKCKIDSVIADECLNHKQQTTMKHYVSIEYKYIEEAYQKYWDVIKLNSKEYSEKHSNEPTKENQEVKPEPVVESVVQEVNPEPKNDILERTQQVIELSKVLEKGHITQEQFDIQVKLLLG